MWLILVRFFLRLIILIIIVTSIFYFYILKYRYDFWIWFIETSWVYSFEKLDLWTDEKVTFNWNQYWFTNNSITLHNNFDKRNCWELKIGDFKDFLCYRENNNHIVYISKNIIKLTPIKTAVYKKLILKKEISPFIKYSFNWHNIDFFYHKNWDIFYQDDISVKKLINIKNIEFIWYNDKWFYIIKDNKLYFMRLSK